LAAAYAAAGGPDGSAAPAVAVLAPPPPGPVRAAKPRTRARFRTGERVIARNLNPPGHTRLPRYARGRRGVIRRDHGVFVLPDSNAHGGGAHRQHCYAVEFAGRELWGRDYPAGERVMIDLWEDYLEAEKVPSRRITMQPAGNPRTVAKPARIATAKAKTGSRMRTR
ncbi:MAG TPA: SH3-like domain-containing protein, partial [Candidatus Binataceae bacterium]|nr:SH3-like domain-containing protein [Candidatus Binataceae bacterium]